jgi:aminoglycoside phosphotransferase (APT) family kinase protein
VRLVEFIEKSQCPARGDMLTHGDFGIDNLLVSHNEVVLLDWEKACPGNPLCDFALGVYYVVFDGGGIPLWFLLDAMFEGYRSAGEVRLDGALLVKSVGLAAAASYLVDIMLATKNELAEQSLFDVRRRRHFERNCRPLYEAFLAHEETLARRIIDHCG